MNDEDLTPIYFYDDLERVSSGILKDPENPQFPWPHDPTLKRALSIWASLMHQGAFYKHPGRINWRIPIGPFPMRWRDLGLLTEAGQLIDQLLCAVDESLVDSPHLREALGFPCVEQEELLREAQRSAKPSFFRLDMTPDEHGALKILEIQLVAGGLGITEALRRAYGDSPQFRGIARHYEECIQGVWSDFQKRAHPLRRGKEHNPLIAVAGSKDSPYRFEHLLLARSISSVNMAIVPLVGMTCQGDDLLLPDGRVPHGLHRLFRSPSAWHHMPKRSSLILKLLRDRKLFVVNVWKDYLEDKRILALVHYPKICKIVHRGLSTECVERLRELIPHTRIVQQAHLKELLGLPRAKRGYYLKKGRSFGSRGLYDGQQISTRHWERACRRAVLEGDWVVQQAVRSCPRHLEYLDLASMSIQQMPAYLRISPYYFRLSDGLMHLADVLVTARPQRSRVHGASDAALTVPTLSG